MESLVIDFKHILCPVDFSDSSARSLDHVAALARWYEGDNIIFIPTIQLTGAFRAALR